MNPDTISIAAMVAILIGVPLEAIWRSRRGFNLTALQRFARACVLNGLVAGIILRNNISIADLGLGYPDLRILVLTTIGSISILTCVDLWGGRRLSRAPLLALQGATKLKEWTSDSYSKRALVVVSLVLLAIYEEVTFRGLVFYLGGTAKLNIIVVYMVGLILFGTQHLSQGIAALYSMGFGAAYSAIFLASGSLYPAILAHIFGNLFTVYWTAPRLALAARVPQEVPLGPKIDEEHMLTHIKSLP